MADDAERDPQTQPPLPTDRPGWTVNIHNDQAGRDQAGRDIIGGDRITTGDATGHGIAVGRRASASGSTEAGSPRRHMTTIEDEIMFVLQDLRERLARLEVKVNQVERLEEQITELNKRLHSSSTAFGATQWVIIVAITSLSTVAATFIAMGR